MPESESQDECYICYAPESTDLPYINLECGCRGTIKIHAECFKRMSTDKCTICKNPVGDKAISLLTIPYKEYYENGNLYIESTIINKTELDYEIHHGDYRSYYEDGKLFVWCQVKRGKMCGFYRSYGRDGELNVELSY